MKIKSKLLTRSDIIECVCVCVQDFVYHGLAAFFYLSAGVDLAYITLVMKTIDFKYYQIDIAAVVRTITSIIIIGLPRVY